MSALLNRVRSGRQASPALVVIGFLAVLAFVGWQFWLYFLAPPPPKPMTPEQRSNREWIKQKIQATGGDMGRLSQEDQERLKQIAGNFAGLAWAEVKKNPDR
jgi:hypothetical protein